MKNCHLETLLCNESGFAARCACCGTVHVGFGNFMVVFAENDLPVFLQNMVVNYRRRNADLDNPRIKNIVIPTPSREVSLLFCLEELRLFIGFLEAASHLLTVKSLAREGCGTEGVHLN